MANYCTNIHNSLFLFIILCLSLSTLLTSASFYNLNLSSSSASARNSHIRGIELPNHPSFNAGCGGELVAPTTPLRQKTEDKFDNNKATNLKLHLKHRSSRDPEMSRKQSVEDSTLSDSLRIQTLFKRITEKKNQNAIQRFSDRKATSTPNQKTSSESEKVSDTSPELSGRLMATLGSGVSLGSGEYFMDVFIGTPPRHFSLILDTGSDLNWIQCLPCNDCFEQSGPVYDPAVSSSYRNVSCNDSRCGLVSSPDPPVHCQSENQSCPYYYWYGDRSNTTGDLALETFTVNLTTPDGAGTEYRRVEGVMFGCGHWNRGLFHGAAGLLGLGRGPLSFSSQLRSLYGHAFSYCLVDRNSDLSVSSKLIFGEDKNLLNHEYLNYTGFVGGAENSVDTFYYVKIKSVFVGGERLQIPQEMWSVAKDGSGGTIIDSGTTLSYFAEPAYPIIREAFVRKLKGKYPIVEDFPVLSPCYNVSGVKNVEMPEFAIEFGDGAVWNFPKQNYFIRLEPEEIECLAILGTPKSALSILGNYQQQNFHILYDLKNSRLGFAPMRCAEV